jgi:hypothetical protein
VVISQHIQNIEGYSDDELKLIKSLMDHQHVDDDDDAPVGTQPSTIVPEVPFSAGEIAGIPRQSKSKKKSKKKSKQSSEGATVTSSPEGDVSTPSSEEAAPSSSVPLPTSSSTRPPPPTKNSEGVDKAKYKRVNFSVKTFKLVPSQRSQCLKSTL